MKMNRLMRTSIANDSFLPFLVVRPTWLFGRNSKIDGIVVFLKKTIQAKCKVQWKINEGVINSWSQQALHVCFKSILSLFSTDRLFARLFHFFALKYLLSLLLIVENFGWLSKSLFDLT